MDDIKTMYQKVKEIFTTEHHIDLDTDNMLTEQLFTDYISSQLEPLVMQKIADVIKKEAEEWNITIHCKNIEESALFSSIARDQVKLFAEYIANFILDKEG